jgi:hypothetical protein
MGRKFVMVLLAVGAVAGFANGCRQMRHHHQARRNAFERHVAAVCVDAARRSDGKDGK